MMHHSILLTGGLGDLFVIESFMPPPKETLKILKTVYWATPRPARQLFEAIYPGLNHVQLEKNLAFFNLAQARQHGHKLDDVQDWTLSRIFALARQNAITRRPSSFLKTKVADIRKFKLPRKYRVCQPNTPMNDAPHARDRAFRQRDWDRLIRGCEEDNLPTVILTTGNEPVPDHKLIINLSNKTTVLEAVEIAKKGISYWGIDSWLSVLMGFKLPADKHSLRVLSRNSYCYAHLDIYYPEHKSHEFVVRELDEPDRRFTANGIQNSLLMGIFE